MAKREKKTPNNNMSDAPVATNGVWEEYFNTKAFAMAPANDEFKKRLAITLIEWASKVTSALDIEDFTDSVGVPPTNYERWIKSSPELKEAHEFAKRRLAGIRLQKSQEGEWNWAACRWALPFYGDKYLEHEKQLASLKEPEKAQGGTTYVIMDKIPGSDIVPERK